MLFLFLGGVLETVYYLLEKVIIYLYSLGGTSRSKRFFQIPFELLYWSKFPIVSTSLYYLMQYLPREFNPLEILYLFSLFAFTMFIVNTTVRTK